MLSEHHRARILELATAEGVPHGPWYPVILPEGRADVRGPTYGRPWGTPVAVCVGGAMSIPTARYVAALAPEVAASMLESPLVTVPSYADRLPVGSILEDDRTVVWVKGPHGWHGTGMGPEPRPTTTILFPATLIRRGPKEPPHAPLV